MPDDPLERLLCDRADRHGDAPALLFGDDSVSYADLEGFAIGLCEQLRERGIRPGDRVAIVAHNSVGFVAAFFGVMMSGGVAVCMSPEAAARELGAMAAVAGPRAAVLGFGAARVDALGPTVAAVASLGMPAWHPSHDRSAIVPRDPQAPAVVAFTSGSTGRPKGAVHRAATISRVSRLYADDVLSGRPTTLLSTLPLYHLGGLVLIMVPALMSGGALALIPRFTSSDAVAAIERHGVDVLMGIPTMLELILRREQARLHRLGSLHTVVMGGAPVLNLLVREVEARLGVRVRVGYGTTEIPGFWCITRENTPAAEAGPLVGWPARGWELRIAGGGEVCVRSEFVMVEYLGDREATSAVLDEHGWLRTGDVGDLRDDGGLVIHGRASDMYIRGGFNVYPREVEETIREHPAVAMAAVHGVADEVLGERGCAWVVPRPGADLGADDLREFLRPLLSRHKLPDVVRVVGELPTNSVGKVDKKALIARAAAVQLWGRA